MSHLDLPFPIYLVSSLVQAYAASLLAILSISDLDQVRGLVFRTELGQE